MEIASSDGVTNRKRSIKRGARVEAEAVLLPHELLSYMDIDPWPSLSISGGWCVTKAPKKQL